VVCGAERRGHMPQKSRALMLMWNDRWKPESLVPVSVRFSIHDTARRLRIMNLRSINIFQLRVFL